MTTAGEVAGTGSEVEAPQRDILGEASSAVTI